MAESPIITLQRQRSLLQMEYAYEKEEFQRLTEATGVERKVQRGMAWHPLSLGRSYYNSLDQLVVEVRRMTNDESRYARNDEYKLPAHSKGNPYSSFVIRHSSLIICHSLFVICHSSFVI